MVKFLLSFKMMDMRDSGPRGKPGEKFFITYRILSRLQALIKITTSGSPGNAGAVPYCRKRAVRISALL